MSVVLVVGSGGREHAIAWKLASSPRVSRVVVAPGNDAWPAEWERWPDVRLGEPASYSAFAERARGAGVALAVIGPDNPLAAGIVDVFDRAGVRCFGPTAAAARIEASKAFAKDVMEKAGVPTARHFVAHSRDEAIAKVRELPWLRGQGWVIKADGLALGKGVCVCGSQEEALEAIDALARVGSTLVIEERLSGQELSCLAFCDGDRAALLEPARDYKRVFDGDQGPNTGGMGAFSPVPGVPAGFAERLRKEVFEPTLRELRARGALFRGVLYAGLMIDGDRYWVLEFNARFGDPETQALLPRMSDDLFDWCEAVASGSIAGKPGVVGFLPEAAVVVIGAARGYPEMPESGRPIEVRGSGDGIFWAGVKKRSGLETAGGRVLGALGMGPSLAEARERAYSNLAHITFEGMHYRKDVAGSHE